MKIVRAIALLVIAIIALALFILWVPITPQFAAQPQPAENYDAAIARVEQLQASEGDDLLPECRSILLTHNEAMTRTIVFFHGISNCPAQFALLGQKFYEMGYNVFIPRLPHHGLANRMTTDLANLTAEELVAVTDQTIDIAAGLGEQVTVVGFSTGGVIAAWAANERSEVDQTVLISPFFSPKAYPAWMVRPLTRALLVLPNKFWWWDESAKEEMAGPRHAYPRYASHAIAQILRLSFAVRSEARQHSPQSGNILLITNAGARETVDNRVATELMTSWQQRGQAEITTFEFESGLDLEHDYIDPSSSSQPIDIIEVIYPILVEQIQRVDQQNE